MQSTIWVEAMVIFFCLLAAGCQEPHTEGVPATMANDANDVVEAMATVVFTDPQEYVMQPFDVLDVKFAYEPNLNERVTIRPDGRISLQLVGEIDAAGLTPAELDRILTEEYSRTLTDPEIAVIVVEFAGQQVYVGGEVLRPGLIQLRPNMTTLEAVLNAGGFRETAEPRNVILLSRSSRNTRLTRTMNLELPQTNAGQSHETFLRPFDVVYVPKSRIAQANKFVDQFLRQMIPVNLSAGFSYTLYEDVRR